MTEEKLQVLHKITIIYDILLSVIVFLISIRLREFIASDRDIDFISHIALLPLIVAIWVYFLSYFGGYKKPMGASHVGYFLAVVRAVGSGFVIVLALLFLLKMKYISRAVLVIFALLDIAALCAVRSCILWFFRRSVRTGGNVLKLLVIGTGNRARMFAEILRGNTEWGVHIIGHLDPDPSLMGSRVLDASVIGGIDDISDVLKNNVVDEVVIAIPRNMISDVEKIAFACEEEGVRLRMMADVFDVHVARMKLDNIGPIPLLTLDPVAQQESKLIVKRVMDLALMILAMPFLLVILGVIAIVIRLDSSGPVFFIQQRVGYRKRVFPMYKFRTMLDGSEKMQEQLEHLNETEGPIFKIANDPRVTRVGVFLRKTSLDELPQIINVFKGEMSLVGPRPMSLRDVNLFDKGIQRKRFSVKPGLTCLWQISGRSQLPFTRWLELDLEYIEQWSIGLDIKILLKTVPAILKGTGAY